MNVSRSGAAQSKLNTAHSSQFANNSRERRPPNLLNGFPVSRCLPSRMNGSSSLSATVKLLKRLTGCFMVSPMPAERAVQHDDHPPVATDNGVLLRKAILLDDCIKDLVRPLRDAGWSVEVGEPDESALYVAVAATADRERFEAALLYSCATDNSTYRKLAETSDAILYRGAPYLQQQYAYGIKVHVGPVTGWQPPMAHNQTHVRRSRPIWNYLKSLGARARLGVRLMKYAREARHDRSPNAKS